MLAERRIVFERMPRNLSAPAVAEPTSEDLLSTYLSMPPQQRDRRFVDTARAAEITGLTQRTIQMWIEFGLILAVNVGRKYKVDVNSLKAYLFSRVEV